MTSESSGSASGLSPDGAAGVWTQQLSNPGTETQPREYHAAEQKAPYQPCNSTGQLQLTTHNEDEIVNKHTAHSNAYVRI